MFAIAIAVAALLLGSLTTSLVYRRKINHLNTRHAHKLEWENCVKYSNGYSAGHEHGAADERSAQLQRMLTPHS